MNIPPMKPPFGKVPTQPRTLQFKPAVVQSKGGPAKTGPVAPPVYRPQPLPKVLQRKAANPSPAQTAPRNQRPVAPPAYRPQPTSHARPAPVQLSARKVGPTHAAAPGGKTSTLQLKQPGKPNPLPRTTFKPQIIQRQTATRGVVQRAADKAFTRSEMKHVQGVVAESKALDEMWAMTAKLHGHDWSQMSVAEQRYFMLDVMNVEASRTRKPPAKGDGKPLLVNFEYKSEIKHGLDPGGSYYHQVKIKYTGSRSGDFALGDQDLHKKGTYRPPNTVWHHYHDYDAAQNTGTMYLMTTLEHSMGHHGGVWMYEKAHNVKYGA